MKFSFTKLVIVFCTVSVLAICTGVSSEEKHFDCPSNKIYDEETKSCAGIHLDPSRSGNDTNCDLQNITEICVKYAGCYPLYWPTTDEDYWTEGYCSCLPEYVPTVNGTCKQPELTAHYGDFCDKVVTCSQTQNLICDPRLSKCDCRKGDIYDSNRQNCRSPIGGVCSNQEVDGVHRECYADNTNCQIFDDDLPYGLCKCNKGLCPDELSGCSPGTCDDDDEPTLTSESPPTAATFPETRPTVPDNNEEDEEDSTTESSGGNSIMATILPHGILQLLLFICGFQVLHNLI